MKEYWKMLKRGLAMALAVVMLLTSSNLGVVLRAAATGTEDPNAVSITLGKLIVENYDELTDGEKLIISSGQLSADAVYSYVVPTDGSSLIKIEKADELNEDVGDEVMGKITASIHEDTYDNKWYPVSYTILVEGLPVENFVDLPMDNGVAYYTFAGSNAFSVRVTYCMDADLSDFDQAAMLDAGALLAADIEKLVGMKTDIVPAKPEGWEACTTEEERIDRFGQAKVDEIKKHDALLNFVEGAASSILGGATLELNPLMVLTFMTMELPDSENLPISKFFGEGLTLVGLLGELYDGVRYPLNEEEYIELPKELELDPNDLFVLTEEENGWSANLGFDNRNRVVRYAVGRLEEQTTGDGLLLKNFLSTHGSKSYLEWLVNPTVYAELVAALIGTDANGNYNDFLAMIGDAALLRVSNQLVDLQEDLKTVEKAAWKMISETAAKYGLTVTNEDELNDLLADGFDSLLKSYAASEGINDQLADLNAQVNEYSDYGLESFKKDTIDNKQDLVDFIAYLERTKGNLSAAVETIYGRWDSALRAAGYTGATIRTKEEAQAAAAQMRDYAAAEQTKIDTAMQTANSLLSSYSVSVEKLEDIDAAITYLYSLQSSDELDAANKALNDAKAAAKKLAEETYGLKNVVINSSADIDAIVAENGPLDKQVQDAWDAYQDSLNEVNNLLGTYLANLPEGVTPPYETIENAEQFEEFCDWMETELAKAKNDFKATLDDINTAVNDANDKLPGGFDKCLVSVSEGDEAEELKNKIQAIRNWMTDLVATAEDMKKDALADANATLTSYEQLEDYVNENGPIESVADIEKLSAYVDEKFAALTADIYKAINEHEDMAEARAVYGYTGADLQSVDDIMSLIAFMNNNAAANVWANANAALPEGITVNSIEDLDAAKEKLDAAKALGMIDEAQYAAGVSGLENARTAIESIPEIESNLRKTRDELVKLANTKTTIKNTLADARQDFDDAEENFAEMKDLVAENGERLDEAEEKLPEAKTFIVDAEKLINNGTLAEKEIELYDLMNAYLLLNDDLPIKKAAMLDEKEKIVTAEENLKAEREELGAEIKTLVENLEKQRNAWSNAAKAKAEYEAVADAMEDEENLKLLTTAAEVADYQDDIDKYLVELPAQLEEAEKAWTTLETIPDYLETLDATRDELDGVKDMLDIMITLLELFCDALEPAATACDTVNGWHAPNELIDYNATADYAALTQAATGLEDNDIEPINVFEKYASTELTANMSMYDVTVVATVQVVNENNELVDLVPYNAGTKTLVAGDETYMGVAGELYHGNLEAYNASIESFVSQYELFDKNAFALGKPVIKNDKGEVIDKPDTLDQNLTIEIPFVPRQYTVTSDVEELAGEYYYGWNLVLPEHENAQKEWEYTVVMNGETTYPRQGETIKILGKTEISRKEGDKSATELVEDIVIATTELDEIAQAILKSNAVDLNDFIYIRKPNNNHLKKVTEGNKVTITALPYNSGAYGDWVAVSATIDGVDAGMVKDGNIGIIETEEAFEKIVVNYELALTSESLGVDLGKYINAPYYLASDYRMQKAALDTLVGAVTVDTNGDGVAAPLEALGMLDRSTEMMGFKLGDVFGMLGTSLEETIKGVIMDKLGVDEVTAIKLLAALAAMDDPAILPASGKTPLYDTLDNYNKQGMAHYYKNSSVYIKQIEQLNAVMQMMPVEDLEKLGGVGNAFKALYYALDSAETNLKKYPVSNLINVASDDLATLLDNLGKYDQTEPFAVPSELTWKVDLAATGDGIELHMVTVNVQGFGTKTSEVITVKPGQPFDHATEAGNIFNGMVEGSIRGYFHLAAESTEVTDDGTVNHIYTYNRTNYEVEVPGVGGVMLNYVDREITLVRHDVPGFAWVYDVVGDPVEKRNSDTEDRKYTLSLAQLDALIAGAEITRTEINVGEADLIDTIEDMGGVLYKDADGKYSVVVGIDMNNTDNLMKFVLGLYANGNVQLGGETLVSNGQFHLQTLIDALLNSGISTNKLNANIAADGTVKHTLDLDDGLTVVGNKPLSGNHLTLIETGLTLNGLEEMPLYLTLTGNASSVKNILSTVAGYGVDVQMNNGSANLAVTVPEPFYTAYLAALSMVGEVDIREMDKVNAEVAVGYVTKMITDILNTEGVSIETFGNTIGKDLSGYESYYDMAKSLMNLVKYDEDGCSIILDLPVIPIKGVIDSLEGSIELPIEGVSLGGLIAEYETGLDVAVGAKINNFANKYDVLFVDVKADGLSKKFGMANLGKDGLLDLQTTSAVVLLHNIEGDLYIPDTLTLVDLNGFNVSGTIKGGASADVLVIDSNYEADKGVVGGVSGNVTVLAGKYNSDVSAFVNDGYMQDSKGVVCNKLFTVSETDNVITVTLNTTVADAKTLLTQEGVFGLAAEILFDQFINHYNVAGVSMDGNTIYNINFEDILGIVSGGTDAIVDTALAFIDAPALAKVFNLLVKDLTDFKTMGAALSDEGTGVIASHEFTTTTWGLELAHKAENNTLTVNFGGSYGKTESKTLQLEIEGQARGAMATLATALGDVLTVDLRVENVEDIYRNDAGQFNLKGDVYGTVVFDFTHNPNYAIMISAILAENADEALRADLVAGIESFYATGSMDELHEVFNAMTIEDVCNSWDEHIGVDSFVEIVDSLGLTCADEIKAAIDDSEMGFDLLIDGIAAGLRLLNEYGIGESITDSGRTLGSLELEDADGSYYGRAGSFEIAGTNRLMDYRLTAASVGAKIYLFSDEVLPIADPSIEINDENIKLGGKLLGVKYDKDKGYLILDTIADGMTLADVLAALHQGADVENDIDNAAAYVKEKSNIVGQDGLVGTGSTITLQAMNGVGETDEVTVTIIVLGDVDGTGDLDANDAVWMRHFALYKREFSDVQKVAGNANGLPANQFNRDGVDSGDAVVVKLKWLGKYGKVLPEYVSPLN